MTSNNQTEKMVSHVVSTSFESIKPEAIDYAKILLLDTIGIILRASQSEVTDYFKRFFEETGDRPKATFFGTYGKCSVVNAAFGNGALGHHIELDDSHGPSRTHAASVIIPAVLAAGESENATLEELLTALVLGYDVQCRLSKALGTVFQHEHNFHPTSVCGTIGAATVAGKLFKLSAEEMKHALGLAACQSCGLVAFETDITHLGKSLQTGVAARNGLTAATLSRYGYKGPPHIFDEPYSIMKAFGRPGDYSHLLTEGLGEYYEVRGSSIKRHPCCAQMHAALDALLEIREAEKLQPGDIESIDVSLSTSAAPIVDANELLTHNIQYVMSLILLKGVAAIEDFETPRWDEPAVQQLASRMHLHPSNELQSHFPSSKGAEVKVTTKAGKVVELRCMNAKGHPQNPLSEKEIKDKFAFLAGSVLDEAAVQQVMEMILSGKGSIRTDEIVALLKPRG
jgi:2-methylcitrate dehydratase PrpD